MATLLGELRRAMAQRSGPGVGAVVGAVFAMIVIAAGIGFGAYHWLSDRPDATEAPTVEVAEVTPSTVEASAELQPVEPPPTLALGAATDTELETGTNDASEEPADADESLLNAEQTAALIGAVLDPEGTDPDALVRSLVPEEDLDGPMGDIVGDVLDDMSSPPQPIEITRRLETPVWDRRSTFRCEFGHGYVIRDVVAKVEGPAFVVEQGCVLHVVDCEIEADVVAEVTGGRLVLERVKARADASVVHISMLGKVDVRQLRMPASAQTAFVAEGGKLLVRDSEIVGETGVSASMSAQARIEGSRIRASGVALRATMSGRIELRDTTFEGSVIHEMQGKVVQLPSASERTPSK